MLVRTKEIKAEENFEKEYMIKIFSYDRQYCLQLSKRKPLIIFEGVLGTMLVS